MRIYVIFVLVILLSPQGLSAQYSNPKPEKDLEEMSRSQVRHYLLDLGKDHPAYSCAKRSQTHTYLSIPGYVVGGGAFAYGLLIQGFMTTFGGGIPENQANAIFGVGVIGIGLGIWQSLEAKKQLKLAKSAYLTNL